jgi:hypothetical protein
MALRVLQFETVRDDDERRNAENDNSAEKLTMPVSGDPCVYIGP